MPRAKRHFIPGYIWHITHRCHKREFLLKFAKDRHRYLQWLYQARKKYGLKILNYMVTSNHTHLLVVDDGDRDVIPNSMKSAMWPFCGYNEIQEPRRKNVLIDYERLQRLFGAKFYDQQRSIHKGWVAEYLGDEARERQEE